MNTFKKTFKTTLITALTALTLGVTGSAFAQSKVSQDFVQIVGVSTQQMQNDHRQVAVQRNAPTKHYDKNFFRNNKVIYRVHAGDTLSKIATRHHVSVNKLVRLNKLYGNKKNHLLIGQILRLR